VGCELVADVARNFSGVCLRVTGASMMPAVWPGDVLHVHRSGLAELHPGQIVLYRRDGRLTAHRIVRIDGDRLITRGDALQYEDPPISAADVVGRVIYMVRNGRLIYPRQSFRLRVGSAILRRSVFCVWITLCLVRLMRRAGSRELSWSS
jgi:signal peptidase